MNRAKQVITFLILGAITIHVLLAVTIILFDWPVNSSTGGSYPKELYRSYVMIGPFFKSERALSSPRYYSRQKSEGRWLEWRDVGAEHFSQYNHSPWQLSRLKQLNHLDYLSRHLLEEKLQQQPHAATMDEIERILEINIFHQPADSIEFVYILDKFDRIKGVRPDTVIIIGKASRP